MKKVIHKYLTNSSYWGFVHILCKDGDSVDENKTSFSNEIVFVTCKKCLKKHYEIQKKNDEKRQSTSSVDLKLKKIQQKWRSDATRN